MLKQVLERCVQGKTLSVNEAEIAMDKMITGEVEQSQIASLLSMLSLRGETAEELAGFCQSLRKKMDPVEHPFSKVIDTCGTGGDGASTFNISTACAIVLGSMGIKVAKHGNRAFSSKSGSADVLEYLGVNIQQTAKEAATSLENNHLCFLFAPHYHQAMKHVASIRKALGFRTAFNLLGPLLNPASCQYQLLGVYDLRHGQKLAEALHELGTTQACIVHGSDGLDECTVTGETTLIELRDHKITTFTIAPEDVGLTRGTMDELKVKSVKESADCILNIFQNKALATQKNIVLLNAAVALYILNEVPSIKSGVDKAREAIESGTAYQFLVQLQKGGSVHHATTNC